MTREDGFGSWPSADEVARIGGPTGPVVPDGAGEAFPGDVEDLPRALRRRIDVALAAGETAAAFLAHAWTTHRDAPAVETLADAARFECARRDVEIDTVRLTPEVELPRETWKRVWYRYLDRLEYRADADEFDVADTILEFVELAPTFVVPADPDDPASEELAIRMDEWPAVPRDRDGEPLDTDLGGRTRGETR